MLNVFSVSRIFGLPHFDELLVISRRLYFARVTTILSKVIFHLREYEEQNPNKIYTKLDENNIKREFLDFNSR